MEERDLFELNLQAGLRQAYFAQCQKKHDEDMINDEKWIEEHE
jgi:hypothetical protein